MHYHARKIKITFQLQVTTISKHRFSQKLNNPHFLERTRLLKKLGLKGQCHEDFAVSDQFWTKIITLRLYSLTKCFCKVTTKISNELHQRGLTIIKFSRIFWRRSIKVWKNWQFFSNFNPFPSLPSEATGDRKQCQYLQIVLNNKPRPLVLEFSWCEDTF